MPLYKGHKCDIWKGTANIQQNGAVYTGTYLNIYSYIDCRYHPLDSVEKIQGGAIDISKDMREVFIKGSLITDLKLYYILRFYDDGTSWIINEPVIHATAVKNYYSAVLELLLAPPKEVVALI